MRVSECFCVSGEKIISPCSLINENHLICHKGARPNDFRKRVKETECVKGRKRGRKNEVILEGEMETVFYFQKNEPTETFIGKE